MQLSILYRGPLSSCNYGCTYCPFAKHQESIAEHRHDDQALQRFLGWVQDQGHHRLSVFFTPWGEALIRKRYQEALVTLTNLANVEKVAVQTNLSCRLEWTERCRKERLGLWVTYHPTQVERGRFLARCLEADRRGVRFSVGIVGMREHLDEADWLRAALPPHIYLWVNAYKRVPEYYTAAEIARFEGIDPLFPLNNTRHPSRGLPCQAGQSVISVDGDGTIRRCHFIRAPIGNIYEADWEQALVARNCANESCGCHIGYVHLDRLRLHEVFAGGVLERIPAQPLWHGAASPTDSAHGIGP